MNAAIETRNFWNDPRVAVTSRSGEDDEKNMRITITVQDDEGEEHDIALPAKYEVCPLCEGRGKHTNPDIDCCGLTREDFDEDPDFEEDYKSGAYDVECSCCHGKRVTLTVDEDACKADPVLREALEAYQDQEDDRASYEAEVRAERAYGC